MLPITCSVLCPSAGVPRHRTRPTRVTPLPAQISPRVRAGCDADPADDPPAHLHTLPNGLFIACASVEEMLTLQRRFPCPARRCSCRATIDTGRAGATAARCNWRPCGQWGVGEDRDVPHRRAVGLVDQQANFPIQPMPESVATVLCGAEWPDSRGPACGGSLEVRRRDNRPVAGRPPRRSPVVARVR